MRGGRRTEPLISAVSWRGRRRPARPAVRRAAIPLSVEMPTLMLAKTELSLSLTDDQLKRDDPLLTQAELRLAELLPGRTRALVPREADESPLPRTPNRAPGPPRCVRGAGARLRSPP